MMSLPLVTPPGTASGGLVWESEHGDAGHTVAEPETAQFSPPAPVVRRTNCGVSEVMRRVI